MRNVANRVVLGLRIFPTSYFIVCALAGAVALGYVYVEMLGSISWPNQQWHNTATIVVLVLHAVLWLAGIVVAFDNARKAQR